MKLPKVVLSIFLVPDCLVAHRAHVDFDLVRESQMGIEAAGDRVSHVALVALPGVSFLCLDDDGGGEEVWGR